MPMAMQEATFRTVLQELAALPRIVSIHSSGAPDLVLDTLAEDAIQGAVLHWWRGSPAQTARAVALGCWFSVNAAGVKHPTDIAQIPLERILTETDHPVGDRTSPLPRQPGAVESVEGALAAIHGVAAEGMRAQVWQNFKRLVNETEVAPLLPSPVRRMLSAA
ncbi:hydrolase TatD [Leifsonia sp. Root227]|nr:hydrolase TatD [Leifsonia sp. Root227]